MRTSLLLPALVVSAAGLWAGCRSPDAGEVETGEHAATEASDCKVLDVQTGRPLSNGELLALEDPVARRVLAGAGCPRSLDAIHAKLETTDTESCKPAQGISGTGGNVTRVVTERSQVLSTPGSFRTVTGRSCAGRAEHELMISAFGIGASSTTLPGNAELIGRDPRSGAFHFYALENGEWRFFGSSEDFVTAGYDCRSGACESKAKKQTRCATCHTGGGLVMKELNFPWLHWEGGTTTPGARELITRLPSLGARGTGLDLENTVSEGNRQWATRRLEVLKTKGVGEVLRPLFCTLDVNLQTMGHPGTPVSVGMAIRSNLFVDPIWNAFQTMNVARADYQELARTNGQRVVDASGKGLRGPNGDVGDTFFFFAFPTRPVNGLDAIYVQHLVEANVIDDDFAKDVAHVDFTRNVFSSARCDLLAAAPDLSPDAMTPAAIRAGFVKNLAGKTGAAAQLRANLEDPTDAAAHRADVDAFFAACAARAPKELLADALAYASQLRNRFRELGISEFAETLPVDDLPDGDRAFDPKTCTLR